MANEPMPVTDDVSFLMLLFRAGCLIWSVWAAHKHEYIEDWGYVRKDSMTDADLAAKSRAEFKKNQKFKA